MAQSYFPHRVSSPVQETANFSILNADRQLKVEDVQEAYIENKDRLVNAIDKTKTILNEIRKFNKEEWVVRYPHVKEELVKAHSIPPSPSVDDNSKHAAEKETVESDFQILRLDLKLGANSSSTAASLVSQLEKSSIANLLDERIAKSASHIDKLRLRVQDISSKVLVTGDLNAGKSTFVNALLRREVMPVDQQPCTTAFCEVHDANENQGEEEVHIVKEGVKYDIKDETTFTRAPISDLETIVGDSDKEQVLILYLADSRTPSESLLNNGVVDISLIDAPGLNRDSLKTTALFARQEEIDVVVFVVSAENHFTLSAKEFLANASNEKAYLFIVVNKFDQIKNKDKCRRLVLEQIKQLSPRTYEDAEDLVHFVDSASALQPFTANPAFDDLESSLRSFVLVKRSKSKLQPVSTYLLHLLSDIHLLSRANALVAEAELEKANNDLAHAKPVFEQMKAGRDGLEESLEVAEEAGTRKAITQAKSSLNDALDRVGKGQLAVDDASVVMPSYPGLFGVWQYAREVRKALLESIDSAVRLAEDHARGITSSGVDEIKEIGERHLPEGVERSRRVFMPEAMFNSTRKSHRGSKLRRTSSGITGAGLGIGLAQRSELLETTFLDLFDVHHQIAMHFGDTKHGKDEEESSLPTALSIISVGAGALTMVGGQALGARGLIEGIIRVSDILGNESTRKWVAPVLGAFTIGLTAYLVLELPTSIPKTIGRRIKTNVICNDEEDEDGFVQTQAERVGRETRKVLRLASWDLRERFRGAMEERGKEVKVAEELSKKATRAKDWFNETASQSNEIRESVQLTHTL